MYEVMLASIDKIDSIIDIYRERVEWFKHNNINQWSKYLEYHPKSEFLNYIKNGKLYLVLNNNTIVGCYVLSTDSDHWQDNVSKAYYLSRVVTKANTSGVGKFIFDRCKQLAIENNQKYLRLECIKTNVKLNSLYEKYGFQFVKFDKNDVFSLREMVL